MRLSLAACVVFLTLSCTPPKPLDLSAATRLVITHTGLTSVSIVETDRGHFVGTGTGADGTVSTVDVRQSGNQVSWTVNSKVVTPEGSSASTRAGTTTSW